MKTKAILRTRKLAASLFVISILLLIYCPAYGQNSQLGIYLKNSSSGGGLGSTVSPQVYFKTGRHEFAMGPNIQKKHLNVAGARVGYNFILNAGDVTEVFLFYDLATFNNAYLSNRTVRSESFMRPENSAYFQAVRINETEQHAGFGIKFLKTGPVSFFAAVGAGLYNTWGLKQNNLFRDRDLCDASLLLSAGVSFKIVPLN